ncbi:PREDICTED: coiled-coil domain-containing protein 81-like [Lepidothrix coronata]|uniref:Coiled-coil domain-containing protein 81-like n=1 Tax=Lepidothrix coronata TaxID=321398 RepID=A0A6J0ILA9_9PASS|nr:PREDICTED: coiled-coil domain-containing protein 81-like [Lepidothrix coronata]
MERRRRVARARGAAAKTEPFPGSLLALSPDLVYFSKDVITKIWDCVSECCRQDLLLKKRVGLMGLGTIHIMKKPIWQGKLEGFLVDSPEFDLDKPFLVGNKLPHGNSLAPELSKADELVCAEVALRLHVPKATVVMCIKATTRVFEWALSSRQNFDFVFKDIGVLVCRGGHVAMRFFEGLAREVAQSENLADSLLQSPNLRQSFIARTEKDISELPPGGVLVLPHFVQVDGKSKPHPVNASLQSTGTTSAEHQLTPGNVPGQRLLSRPRVSPSRIRDVEVAGREKRKADAGGQRGRTPRAKQVLANLESFRVSREQCMKALQINKLRKCLVKQKELHDPGEEQKWDVGSGQPQCTRKNGIKESLTWVCELLLCTREQQCLVTQVSLLDTD